MPSRQRQFPEDQCDCKSQPAPNRDFIAPALLHPPLSLTRIAGLLEGRVDCLPWALREVEGLGLAGVAQLVEQLICKTSAIAFTLKQVQESPRNFLCCFPSKFSTELIPSLAVNFHSLGKGPLFSKAVMRCLRLLDWSKK